MMTAARLVVVLALASLLVIHAAETRPSFVEWIKQGSGRVQSAYEEVETETACLQVTGLKNCRCFNEKTLVEGSDPTCFGEYTEVKLACCVSEDDQKYTRSVEELVGEKLHVGSCSIRQYFFTEPITYHGHSDCKMIGTFEGSCHLTEKAGQCGSPLCEGMTLNLQGDILRYGNVGFIHGPFDRQVDEDCARYPPIVYPKTPNKKTPAKIQYSKGGDDGPKFLVGQGDIYAGTFSVVSRYHKTPYKVGTYQLVSSTGASYKEVSTPPEKCYVAKDGAAALDFIKSGDY